MQLTTEQLPLTTESFFQLQMYAAMQNMRGLPEQDTGDKFLQKLFSILQTTPAKQFLRKLGRTRENYMIGDVNTNFSSALVILLHQKTRPRQSYGKEAKILSWCIRNMKSSGSSCLLYQRSITCFKHCPYLRSYITDIRSVILYRSK